MVLDPGAALEEANVVVGVDKVVRVGVDLLEEANVVMGVGLADFCGRALGH